MNTSLSCLRNDEPPLAVIQVAGPLNLASVPQLRTAVLKTLVDEPDAILIDATNLTVADDLHLMIFMALARQAAGWPSIPILLCATNPAITTSLHRLGLDRHILICANLAQGRQRAAERPLPARLTSTFGPEPRSVTLARQMVVTACRSWQLDHLADPAEFVITELASNAVRHARTPFVLSLTRAKRKLHLAVRDRAHNPARLVGPTSDNGEGGRGLIIVEALTSGWGCIPVSDGKVTWATLSIQP
jgi:anti-anti-sigma regulatory factor/anti-sigma regulatory factor (Ser/Thr protein kinase)